MKAPQQSISNIIKHQLCTHVIREGTRKGVKPKGRLRSTRIATYEG